MNDKIKYLKTLLILLRSKIFGKDKESALISIEQLFNLLEAVKNEIPLYSFLFASVSQIKSLIQDENYNQAFDLADCIHVVPDIAVSSHRDWKLYWEIYVEKYMNDWGSLSLLQFKEQILNLDVIDQTISLYNTENKP